MKNNMLAENVVETQDLTKTFGEDIAVRSLNMQVPRGTIFGFVGPSGCGKTTTVRLLTGFYKPTSGTLSVLGKNPADFSDSDREKIGYLIQQFVLYPDLTVWENLNFAASFYGVGPFRSGRLNKLLDFVELAGDKNKLARDLSGGMKRRLSLAAALVHNPELLFLDEPTTGIDPILRRKFWDYFKELQSEGHTLFITTQYVGEAAYCDLVGVMYGGRLLMIETPDGLRRKAYGGDVIGIRTNEAIRLEHRHQMESLPFVRGKVKIVSDQEVEVVVNEASTAIQLLLEWCRAQKLSVEMMEQKSPPFDDVFIRIIETEIETEIAND
ncbi:MAG TPA: ABC transporter ATP-binding protein [Anaerolineales bacterium]|nr:ABC transporter ATP-binding protein [Anaerolineales bacterium]